MVFGLVLSPIRHTYDPVRNPFIFEFDIRVVLSDLRRRDAGYDTKKLPKVQPKRIVRY